LTAYTLSYSHNGYSGTFDPFNGSSSFTSPHSALTWTYGATSSKSGSDSYNTSADKAISIPTDAAHINNRSVSWSYGDVSSASSGSYAPSQQNNGSFVIPNSLEHLAEWDNGCLTIENNLCVTGNITTTGGVFYTSDERKKENINYIDEESKDNVRNIPLRYFNFKEDNTKRKMYGVIAQEVEAAGFDEMIYTNEEGYKSVDYTSLLILRISSLERTINTLLNKIVDLEQRIPKDE
jgi:hypothetical protein